MGSDFQRTILWVFFGMSLFMLWDRWQVANGHTSMFGMTPTTQQAPRADAAAPAKDAVPGGVPTPSAAVAAAAGAAAVPAPAAAGAVAPPATAATPAALTKGEPVVIQTDLIRATIDNEGAVLARLQLLKERHALDTKQTGLIGLVTGAKPPADNDVVLLEVDPARVYVAQTGLVGPAGSSLPNHRSLFTAEPGPRTLEAGQDTLAVRFVSEQGGVKVVKTYTFTRGSYEIKVTHEVLNTGAAPVQPSLYYQLMRDGNKPEGESGFYSTYTGPALYTAAEHFQKIAFSDIEKGKASFPKTADNGWIGMIQHYFVSAWVPPEGTPRENYVRTVDKNLYAIGSIVPLAALAPGASAVSEARFYAGPQDQTRLKAIAPGLDLVVDYGWLTFIAKPIYWLLEFLHGLVGNWGWAIVLLTVLIKAAFYPLSAASYKSMARMKAVMPRIAKIREQHPDDKQKQNMAMMELYKTEKINPLGGCLPILIQIPVFISLYWVLLASVEIRNQPWMLWIHDLATPDPWFILPVLMTATSVVQMKLNPPPPDPIQAKVMALMPYIFGVMFLFFPAGLVLYWLTNNILSIAQQWYVNKQIEGAKPVG